MWPWLIGVIPLMMASKATTVGDNHRPYTMVNYCMVDYGGFSSNRDTPKMVIVDY